MKSLAFLLLTILFLSSCGNYKVRLNKGNTILLVPATVNSSANREIGEKVCVFTHDNYKWFFVSGSIYIDTTYYDLSLQEQTTYRTGVVIEKN